VGLDADQRERVLAAATPLFSEHGPGLVTWRWIAMVSEVPADAVSVEWPTIEELLSSVLDRLSDQVEGFAARALTLEEADQYESVINTYHRIVARALLDDINAAPRLQNLADIETWVAAFGDGHELDDHTTRLRLCQSFALEWGWRLFGPHIKQVCGLADESDAQLVADTRWLEGEIMRIRGTAPS